MKSIINLLSLFICITSHSQFVNYINQKPINLNEEGYRYSDSIRDIHQFPSNIQKVASEIIRIETGEFHDSIQFEKGQIVNLQKYTDLEFRDSNLVNYYYFNYHIPKYVLYFKLTSREIHIQAIYIKIELDEYGQILSLTWPKHFDKKKQLIGFESINSQIQSFINQHKEYDNPSVEFIFNSEKKPFVWNVTITQSKLGAGFANGTSLNAIFEGIEKQ